MLGAFAGIRIHDYYAGKGLLLHLKKVQSKWSTISHISLLGNPLYNFIPPFPLVQQQIARLFWETSTQENRSPPKKAENQSQVSIAGKSWWSRTGYISAIQMFA